MEGLRASSLALVAEVLVGSCGRSSADRGGQAPITIEARMRSGPRPSFVDPGDRGERLWKALCRFYELTRYEPAWIASDRPRWEAAELLQAIEDARQHGLDPAEYELQTLAALRTEKSRNPFKRGSLEPEQVAEADLRLSYMFLKYASHLLTGRVDPEGGGPAMVWSTARGRPLGRAQARARYRPRSRDARVAGPAPSPVPGATAWADPQGALHFAPDLYGHDERQARVLSRSGTVRAAGAASTADRDDH